MLTFEEILSPGLSAHCNHCGVKTYFTGYQRYRLDDDSKVQLIPEYQCQDCGKLTFSMPDTPTNDQILSKRCQCSGQFRRDKPLFCTCRLINKTPINVS